MVLTMRCRKRQYGFTITELLVAVGLLAGIMAASGIVFHHAVKTQRTSSAINEIMLKAQAITEQLDRDFSGINKDTLIFVIWAAFPERDDLFQVIDEEPPFDVPDRYVRMDRVFFFSRNNFRTYDEVWWQDGSGPVQGYLEGTDARIMYCLGQEAESGDPADYTDDTRAGALAPQDRILVRSQHLYSPLQMLDDSGTVFFPFADNAGNFYSPPEQFYLDNIEYEFDTIPPEDWMNLPEDMLNEILTMTMDVTVGGATVADSTIAVDEDYPLTYHMMLTPRVGQFMVQGWYEGQNVDGNLEKRWFPEADPDGDGNYDDSDFLLEVGINPPRIDDTQVGVANLPGLLYPDYLIIGSQSSVDYGLSYDPPTGVGGDYKVLYGPKFSKENVDEIPGLGRALKFTFTLYDSKGIFPDGKTFTHIVSLE